jgi:hypothetical protein
MEAVYAVCLQYPLVLLFLLALDNATTSIGLKIQSIISTQGKQQQNNKGVTLTKRQLKKTMLDLASGIAQAIQAYSKTISDETLFEKLRFAKAAYLKGGDNNAISLCRTIYDIVNAIPVLTREPFGVSDAVLLSFKNSTDDFETNGAPSTRNVITKKTSLTKMLVTLVKEGNSIMRNQILKLADQLQEDYPEFYIEVNQAAKLIVANTHTKARVEAVDDSTNMVIQGMKVKVLQNGQEGLTNTKGLCVLYLDAGTYTFEYSKDNYITMTVTVKIKRGSNTLKAEMSPAFVIPAVNPAPVNNQ